MCDRFTGRTLNTLASMNENVGLHWAQVHFVTKLLPGDCLRALNLNFHLPQIDALQRWPFTTFKGLKPSEAVMEDAVHNEQTSYNCKE